MKRNSYTSTQSKIEYLKKNYQNIMKINPYIDRGALIEIKELLCDMGFYKSKAYYVPDQSVINIILQVQGKKRIYSRTTTTNKRDK